MELYDDFPSRKLHVQGKDSKKVFIGGLVTGIFIGGVIMFLLMGTLFINEFI